MRKLYSYFFFVHFRNVLDEFLKELVILGLTDTPEECREDTKKYNNLLVQQIKVVDTDGNLKLVYPSRADLNFDDHFIAVIRE